MWLNLDSFSVIRLSSFIVSLFIAIFLFRLKSRSTPTLLLAWFFSGASLITLSLFLEFACPYYWQPYNLKNLVIPISHVVGPCLAALSLVLFAYHFPHFQKPDRAEYRIVLSLFATADLGTLVAALFNFVVLTRGRSDFRFEHSFYILLYVVLAVQFTLAVFLLFRKAVRFSHGKHRSWWLRLVRCSGPDALAARSLALVLCLLVLAVAVYELMTVGVIPFNLATYVIWLIYLLFFFSFIVTYLNHTVERTTFQVKLVGLALVFIVGILGLVSMVIGRSYAKDYTNSNLIAASQTLHFQPNRFGSYTIDRGALRFDPVLGNRIEMQIGDHQTVQMPFSFPFFAENYRTLQVLHGPMIFLGETFRENGWGGYDPQATIAPLLVNLDPVHGRGVYTNSQADRVTVTWNQMPERGYDNQNTVQLVLFSDGSFDISYEQLDIRSSYSAIRMYAFTTANLTGQHPGASGKPVPSGPKLIGIHPGDWNAPLQRIRFSQDLPYTSREPGIIFESYENDFYEYLQKRMSILVVVLVISSLLVLFVFPMMFQTSVIRPLQTLYKGMEQVDRGDLRVTVTPQFNDEIGAVTLFFNRMLQSIQEAEANFRTLAENAQDGILIVRQDGRIAYANRSVEWISGHSLSDLIDRPIQEVVRLNKGSADSDRFWASVSRQAEAKHLECHVMSKGKVLRPVEMTISNTYWHRIPALVVVLRDISERVLREEKERRHQQIMIQADKLTTLGILATAVAHDINNPTQVILTTIRILLRAWNEVHPNLTNNIAGKEQIEIAGFEMNELLDNITGWLADIESNSQRINNYVQSLRSYIRGQPSTMASVNLSTVVRSAVELMSYHIRRASDRFILRLDDTIPSIRGNPQQLEQVVINLIMNACQSLQDRDAEVEVSTSHNRNSGSVVLTVRDGGCGIPEENMERIMEPFFTTRTETGGTGMGLYIVDSIVKEHRGELSITSSIGRGTTVGVAFPQEDRI